MRVAQCLTGALKDRRGRQGWDARRGIQRDASQLLALGLKKLVFSEPLSKRPGSRPLGDTLWDPAQRDRAQPDSPPREPRDSRWALLSAAVEGFVRAAAGSCAAGGVSLGGRVWGRAQIHLLSPPGNGHAPSPRPTRLQEATWVASEIPLTKCLSVA